MHASYQALLDDPAIDAVYNPLPNGLHYEWAVKALKAGKHVLLEKPSCSNAAEAQSLFTSELLKPIGEGDGKALVLLEAFHPWFHPAPRKFLELVDKPNVVEAFAALPIPKGVVGKKDIRFEFNLAGGCLMDAGTYCVRLLRQIFGEEPVECLEVKMRKPGFEGADERIDEAVEAKWRWPNGGMGSIQADLVTPWSIPLHLPITRAVHREILVEDGTLSEGREHLMSKIVTLWNFVAPSLWHRIDVTETHTIRDKSDNGAVVKTWKETKHVKEYGDGERESWTTYRWQLEEFVNRVRGKDGSGVWVTNEDSIKQMRVLDGAYQKAGLPLRPSSDFL